MNLSDVAIVSMLKTFGKRHVEGSSDTPRIHLYEGVQPDEASVSTSGSLVSFPFIYHTAGVNTLDDPVINNHPASIDVDISLDSSMQAPPGTSDLTYFKISDALYRVLVEGSVGTVDANMVLGSTHLVTDDAVFVDSYEYAENK